MRVSQVQAEKEALLSPGGHLTPRAPPRPGPSPLPPELQSQSMYPQKLHVGSGFWGGRQPYWPIMRPLAHVGHGHHL